MAHVISLLQKVAAKVAGRHVQSLSKTFCTFSPSPALPQAARDSTTYEERYFSQNGEPEIPDAWLKPTG